MGYHEEIERLAEEVGYKAANVIFLKGLLKKFVELSQNEIEVLTPPSTALKHDQILKHIVFNDSSDPQNTINALWQEFKKEQSGQTILTDKSKILLSNIRSKIKACFDKENVFDFKDTNISEITSSYAMVRSTGMEDSVDDANPGGNDSFASESSKEKLSSSIGRVVASYFSERSLEQRLASGEDIASSDMFLPCLLQDLIGEDPTIKANKSSSSIISGVVYTSKGASTIQAAPGHGELVVASRGNVDSYYVRKDSLVFAEKMHKGFRMKPILDEERGKISLEQVVNDFKRETDFALKSEAISRIHEVSQYIKDKYGMEMDIEFVYNGDEKKLYIVQARAVTTSKEVSHIKPSALSPEAIGLDSDILEAKHSVKDIITLHTKSAVIAYSQEDVIYTKDIKQALSVYLASPTNSKPKAVMVEEYAPSTSHEAGEFSKFRVPVLRVEDIEEAKKIFDDSAKIVVIDPQRKLLARLSEEASSNPESYIEEGLFRSSMNSYSSIMGEAEYSKEWLEEFKEQNKGTPKLKVTNNSLEQSIEGLLNISNATNVLDTKGVYKLQEAILYNMVSYAARESISPELLSNIYLYAQKLDEYYRNGIDLENREEYLDLATKFGGLFLARNEAGKAVDSIVAELHQNKLDETSKQIASIATIGSDYLKELLNLSPRFIHDKNKEDWGKFCQDLLSHQDQDNIARLSSLVGSLAKHNVLDIWLNMNFVQAHKDNPNSRDILLKLGSEYKSSIDGIEELASVTPDLIAMRSNIGNFSSPTNFQHLFENLQERLQRTHPKLRFTKDRSDFEKMILIKQMDELVDILDLIAKSVQTSQLYNKEQKPIQVQNFKAILEEMSDLFVLLEGHFNNIRAKNNIEYLTETLKNSDDKSEKQLDISSKFSMPSLDGAKYLITCNSRSLADIHTILHQKLIKITRSYCDFEPELPESLRQLKAFNMEYNKAENKLDCSSNIEIADSKIVMNIDYPLREHSAKIEAIYNIKDQKTHIKFKLYGGNEDNRYGKAIEYLYYVNNILGNKIEDINFTTNTIECEVSIVDDKTFNKVLDIWEQLMDLTFLRVKTIPTLNDVKLTDLVPSDILKKIKLATSEHTIIYYKKGWTDFFKFCNQDIDIMEALASSDAAIFCQSKSCFEKLSKITDPQQIKALTSYSADECYEEEYFTFDQLASINNAKIIKDLVDQDVHDIYETYSLDEVLDLYNTCKYMSVDFKDYVEMLISGGFPIYTIEGYEEESSNIVGEDNPTDLIVF